MDDAAVTQRNQVLHWTQRNDRRIHDAVPTSFEDDRIRAHLPAIYDEVPFRRRGDLSLPQFLARIEQAKVNQMLTWR